MQKAPKSPKKAEQSRRKGKSTQEDLIGAIKNAFKNTKGRIDPRYLWTAGGVHRFRVNFWSEVMIIHSEFIHVIEENKELTISRNL